MDKVIKMDIDSLKTNPKNSRKHPLKQINALAKCIGELGFINPVLIDQDNMIIGGHCRVLAAKQLGLKKVPAIKITHLTPTQIKQYTIADNRLAEMSSWDSKTLENELRELLEDGLDLSVIGFDDFFQVENEEIDIVEEKENTLTVTVKCKDEMEQEVLFHDLKSKGYKVSIK